MSGRYVPLKKESQLAEVDVLFFDSQAPFESLKSCVIARQTIACSLVAAMNDLDKTSKNFELSLKQTCDAVTLLMNDVVSMIPSLFSGR